MRRCRMLISGVVQGVYFRHHTHLEAESLGLKGWVRNLSDGRVEVLAEGEQAAVEKLVDWCHIGPSMARVDEVVVEEQIYTGDLPEFYIQHGRSSL